MWEYEGSWVLKERQAKVLNARLSSDIRSVKCCEFSLFSKHWSATKYYLVDYII